MLINTYLDTEDFVHLYYPEDEPSPPQGCGAGARMASKYPRPRSPDYNQITPDMTDRERYRAPPPPEPPPHRVRAADLYPRVRTHCDEPGLEVAFTPICGEFVQWIGRTSDGGTLAMSNYRLHVQSRKRNGPGTSVPLRLIDALEIRDILHLIVLCKHGRQFVCRFNTSEQCEEWLRRISTGLAPICTVEETFAAAYAAWAKEQPPTSIHRALMRESHKLESHKHWFPTEYDRLGFSSSKAWRVTNANEDYKLCPSYPQKLVVPHNICDEDLEIVARFRAMRRIPAVVWRHRNGAVIARSSQPEVGWLGWSRSSEDERLLSAFVAACHGDSPHAKQQKLLIVDARSYASAVTNRARGGGCECQQYYPLADIQFMCLPNIHHVRKSFHNLRTLIAETSDQTNWHSSLENTLWLQYVAGLLRGACVVARGAAGGRPVLVHCSDGWDRTPQLVASAQLMLDPYYRTVAGFRVLIEREWLDFGHKFGDRCGHQFGPEDNNERSPVFVQWLDVVRQMMLQYPCSFEFNDAYLIKLATHVHSCMFGTFLCNTTKERTEARVPETTAAVWLLLTAPSYRNHLYSPMHVDHVLWPDYSVRAMQLWWTLFCGEREQPHMDFNDSYAQPAKPVANNGPMTKTRSCDNLASDSAGDGKRTAQRRCSDPSLSPDLMKLSMVAADTDSRRALTDSCVDVLPTDSDQVDGLNPNHFTGTSPPRDETSLERELGAAVHTEDKVIEHSPDDLEASTRTIVGGASDAGGGACDAGGGACEPPPDVFVCGSYTDIMPIHEHTRESARTRNISITWRSVSESSNQSLNGFDIGESTPRDTNPPITAGVSLIDSRESSPLDNHHSTESDLVNHNVIDVEEELVNHNYEELANHNAVDDELANHNGENGIVNGVNGIDDISSKFGGLEMNGGRSSASSSSSCSGTRRASLLTLCPASPRTRPDTKGAGCAGYCACAGAAAPDALDGLPPAADAAQARLQQIILHQKKVVEELAGQLRDARSMLRLASPGPALPPPTSGETQLVTSASGSSGSTSSASSVEVGEEARGVVWIPDSAAPRCQHCRGAFWLARRRHHCRRCGGIFCGSCSDMSWGDAGSIRVCRRCRAMR